MRSDLDGNAELKLEAYLVCLEERVVYRLKLLKYIVALFSVDHGTQLLVQFFYRNVVLVPGQRITYDHAAVLLL